MRRSGALAVVVGVVLIAGSGCASSARSPFGGGSVPEIVAALRRHHLEICGPPVRHAPNANQAVATTAIQVAIDCHDDHGIVVIDRFTSAEDRDAAARNFEVNTHPRLDGAVWTWKSFTINAIGGASTEVQDRITDAMDDLGAE